MSQGLNFRSQAVFRVVTLVGGGKHKEQNTRGQAQEGHRTCLRSLHRGDPWRDSALSLLRAWDQSLVGKLRSHKPHSAAKKNFFFN